MFTCVNCKRTRVELCICVLQIYTGSNDGSIHAVKINLMKNFRCWVRTDWLFFPPVVIMAFKGLVFCSSLT